MSLYNERVLEQLRRIHAPVVTGVPPTNAYRDMMQLPDGELRHYGVGRTGGDVYPIYLSSRDCGFSWQEHPASEENPGACVKSPWSNDWLTVIAIRNGRKHEWSTRDEADLEDGTYVFRSADIDGPFEVQRISDHIHGMPRQPLALRQRKRWLVATSTVGPGVEDFHPAVLYSDDDGHSWERVLLEAVAPHTVEWPHKGVRWQNLGVEPTIVELADGRLWMLLRTSQDNHYEAFSDDGGETWTVPAPSRFYATLTMPLLHRLQDGRILCIWCNTTPLPELDHDTQLELRDEERNGEWEDVFTNRDALHAAISEDEGRTWIGFRELILDERRNDADFRTSGGNPVNDKSIHQSQMVELPEGRILVSLGQHPLCRRFLIFSLDWLYETERSDDFALGLPDWSVHQYVRSLSGIRLGGRGHCAWNRRPGAQLIPHPDGGRTEVLQIARYPDPRLLYEVQGVVWNFPIASAGILKLRLRQPAGGAGTRVCLVDRWFNPVDPVVNHFAQYVLEIDRAGAINGQPGLKPDTWHDLNLRWTDPVTDEAEYRLDDSGPWAAVSLTRPALNGISYMHIQSMAEEADPAGLLIESVEFKKQDPAGRDGET